MRLHPITLLLLFAAALRLEADVMLSTQDSGLFGVPDMGQGLLLFQARYLSDQMTELAQTLFYLAGAVWIETLSRWAGRLKAARLRQGAKGTPAS